MTVLCNFSHKETDAMEAFQTFGWDCSNKHLMATQNGKLEMISLKLFELFDNIVLFEIKCCCVHNDSNYVMFCL